MPASMPVTTPGSTPGSTPSSTQASLSPRCVAIVEDETALRENYRLAIEKAGYIARTFADRPSALQALEADPADLVIVDVGLGIESEGGFELCRELRARSASLPIIILTARDSELDTISGLRLGADDYLTKDISLAHLTARVNSLFRRIDAGKNNVQDENQNTGVGGLSIDQEQMFAWWHSTRVDLTVTEFKLVESLVVRPGQVKTRQQLMDAANVVLDDQTITAHVKRIRKKFYSIDSQFDCIQTVYGMGYRWVAIEPSLDE